MNKLSRFTLFFVLLLIDYSSCSASGVSSGGPKVTDIVYFDVTQGGNPLGRIEIGLFGKTGNFF